MNKSYSKLKHIVKSNLILEERHLRKLNENDSEVFNKELVTNFEKFARNQGLTRFIPGSDENTIVWHKPLTDTNYLMVVLHKLSPDFGEQDTSTPEMSVYVDENKGEQVKWSKGEIIDNDSVEIKTYPNRGNQDIESDLNSILNLLSNDIKKITTKFKSETNSSLTNSNKKSSDEEEEYVKDMLSGEDEDY